MITISVDDQPEVLVLMQKMLSAIDPQGTHLTADSMKEAFPLLTQEVQIIFLDIEMSGINGIEAADLLQKNYPKLNIIFVTGHPEYSLSAHEVFPSGFLTKPVDEQDLRRAISHLRFPIEQEPAALTVRCAPFALFVGDKPFDFKSSRTIELFAYLVYKNGAFVTNGELLAILWDGSTDKDSRLRKLIMDMRSCLNEIGAGNIVVKKYGRIGLDMKALRCIGDVKEIEAQFSWI